MDFTAAKSELLLNPRHWETVKEQEISTSLSRALIRLREAGVLRLDNRSDSPARMEMLLQVSGSWRLPMLFAREPRHETC